MACLALLAANAEGYDQDWAIEPMGDILVQGVEVISFSDTTPTLNDNKECSVRLFEEDCITVGGSSVYMNMVDTISVSDSSPQSSVSTRRSKSSSYYTAMDPYRGRTPSVQESIAR
jgi:hypothetical protein